MAVEDQADGFVSVSWRFHDRFVEGEVEAAECLIGLFPFFLPSLLLAARVDAKCGVECSCVGGVASVGKDEEAVGSRQPAQRGTKHYCQALFSAVL